MVAKLQTAAMFSFLLPAFSVALLGYLGYGDYIEARDTGNSKATRYQLRSVAVTIAVLSASFLLYHTFPQYYHKMGIFRISWFRNATMILFSFAISYLWFLFFRALDIFEKEKSGPLLFLFILACGSTFLVFPLGDLIRGFGLSLDGSFAGDFLYCWLAIGVPEEMVKILPFLLFLIFSKKINEPYDYILYGGVCALGFAFIENIGYLSNTSMMALAGRALYSTVSHVFDIAIICYFLAIARHKGTNRFIAFAKGFLLATLAHGFYDFWLISQSFSYPLVTIFFFLISIHFLTMMINNLLNISPYFEPSRRLRAAKYKFYLTTYLILLCAGGFVFILFSKGQEWAVAFAEDTVYYQSYTLVYLVVSFTSLNVIPGYLMPLQRPKNVLLPLVNRHPNYLGLRVQLKAAGRSQAKAIEHFRKDLPVEAYFSKRVVVNGNFNWYHITPDEFPGRWLELGFQLIACPVKFEEHLLNGKFQYCRLAMITNEKALHKVVLDTADLRPLGNGRIQLIRKPSPLLS